MTERSGLTPEQRAELLRVANSPSYGHELLALVERFVREAWEAAEANGAAMLFMQDLKNELAINLEKAERELKELREAGAAPSDAAVVTEETRVAMRELSGLFTQHGGAEACLAWVRAAEARARERQTL